MVLACQERDDLTLYVVIFLEELLNFDNRYIMILLEMVTSFIPQKIFTFAEDGRFLVI